MNVGIEWERGGQAVSFLLIHKLDFEYSALHSGANCIFLPKNLSSFSVAGSVLPALAGEWNTFRKGDINIWASLYDIYSWSYFSQKLL